MGKAFAVGLRTLMCASNTNEFICTSVQIKSAKLINLCVNKLKCKYAV